MIKFSLIIQNFLNSNLEKKIFYFKKKLYFVNENFIVI